MRYARSKRHQFTLIGPEVNKAARLEEIHQQDVFTGTPVIGPIRLSKEFVQSLSHSSRKRYKGCSTATAKNIGEIEFFS